MIRNRFAQFLQQRRHRHQRNNIIPQQPAELASQRPPQWQYDYYHFKSELSDVVTTNRDIQQLIDQYTLNPTVYNHRALERLLQINCKRINQIQNWVSRFPYSREPPIAVQLQRNLVRHFQSEVLTHINTIFFFRNRLSQLVEQRNARQNSFNSLNNSRSFAYSNLNNSVQERGESIKQVSAQIQALNSILRKMGDIVASQGDLINRIDQNLNQGVDHVSKGKGLLRRRAQEQQGEGEFSCQGKINKVIVSLYITNLVLIFILVLKNI